MDSRPLRRTKLLYFSINEGPLTRIEKNDFRGNDKIRVSGYNPMNVLKDME
jgi:hypothetical protein